MRRMSKKRKLDTNLQDNWNIELHFGKCRRELTMEAVDDQKMK